MNSIDLRIRQYQLETVLGEGNFKDLEDGRRICGELNDIKRSFKLKSNSNLELEVIRIIK